MKVRNGFVSNSSSSSFIVAYKGSLNDELNKAFKLPQNFPIKNLNVTKLFENNTNEKFETVEEYLKFVEEDWDIDSEIPSLIKEGFNVIYGSFSSESGDSLEYFLCESDINYKSENLIIKKEGGY